MSIFDMFRGGPSEADRNFKVEEVETGNKAIEFNLGDHPEIQKYLQEKGNTEVIGDRAPDLAGMEQQRAAMQELIGLV